MTSQDEENAIKSDASPEADVQVHAGSSMNDSGTCKEIDTPLTQARSPDVHGHVYFIRAADAIKIGFSIDPPGRLASLQTSNPEDLHLMGAVRGTTADERELHVMFCHLRLRGEWFRAEEELIDHIKSVLIDEEWEHRRPAPSLETLAIIKDLINQRAGYGALTPIGYRHSNLIEMTRNIEYAEGEQRQNLTASIARTVREIADLRTRANQ